MRSIGFTGTREGMSLRQYSQLRLVLSWISNIKEGSSADPTFGRFHHGAAEGADTQASILAVEMGWGEVPYRVDIGPGFAVRCLQRNRLIVSVLEILIAAPLTNVEELRSGTWATIRYAREARKPIIMLSR